MSEDLNLNCWLVDSLLIDVNKEIANKFTRFQDAITQASIIFVHSVNSLF